MNLDDNFYDRKTWKEVQQIISNRIQTEYDKYHKLLPDEWIKITTAKIIHSLKEIFTD